MRLLIDQNLPVRVADALRAGGHDVVHVADRGLSRAADAAILVLAEVEGRTIVTEDSDFSALLARSGALTPSIVLVRTGETMTREEQAGMLLANLPAVSSQLDAGAIVVFAPGPRARPSAPGRRPSSVAR